MTLDQIKQAVETGREVYWSSDLYRVVRIGKREFRGETLSEYAIVCLANGSMCTLEYPLGRLYGDEKDFYVKETI